MKKGKILSFILALGVIISPVVSTANASELTKSEHESVNFGKENSKASTKSEMFPANSTQGSNAPMAGTLVGMETNAYLYQSQVASYGLTTCSKSCLDLKVANYLYRNNLVIDWNSDHTTNNISAIAVSKGGSYNKDSTYYSASDHSAMDSYGQIVADRTIDRDL